DPQGPAPDSPIAWRNYYDFGDPVGFRLNATREWLHANGWRDFFDFNPENHPDHDIGFTRYYFPGKAHNDYWEDEGVFGHFISTVIKPPSLAGVNLPKTVPPPRSRLLPWVVSPTLPYVLAMALVFVAVYILYKAVGAFLEDSGD